MAVINEVTICNSALIKLGAERILSLDDDSKSGRLCKLRYELALDYVTSRYPWRFARKRAVLAPTGVAPAFGYDNAFSLPVDYLGLFLISDSTADENYLDDFKVENGEILSNESVLYLIYIRKLKVADLVKVSPSFAEAVSLYLAWDLVMDITQSDSSRDILMKEFKAGFKHAKTQDARSDSPRALEANEYVDSRFTPSSG